MADNLYGVKQASKTMLKPISSSNSLAFSSNLSALISKSTSDTTSSSARVRPSKGKSDIFTAHNKSVKKRAAVDALEDGEHRHQTRDNLGTVDAATLHRSKRNMEEKSRLYNAMKRGEYVGKDGQGDDCGLVDFDRKWAEQEANGKQSDSDMTGSEDPDTDEDAVEYLDEFGRTRKGTKRDVEREERRKRVQEDVKKEVEQLQARPQMPTNVIYGDTVQHNAFNPDQTVAEKMAEIAKKRDRSATPPPDSHYDANAEVRAKGTGFYGFSADAEGRKKEMDDLEKQRLKTEKIRKAREGARETRRREIEERKKTLAKERSRAEADIFLNELTIPGVGQPNAK